MQNLLSNGACENFGSPQNVFESTCQLRILDYHSFVPVLFATM